MNSAIPSHRIRFHIAMPSDQYLAYYQGQAQNIVVRSTDNRNIRFPANALRRFLTHNGVHGLFEIQFDGNNKLIGVEKIQ